ncbi:aminotransferase class I/II-fold pyridoxal phosphate-dependent enzyme [Bacillaceae bacterium SIJ1]|uniref:aminotransferase class I/II-fold pyridoxal phosphate-dependent enzyme n=1 Tax=Litoribacterium kuwaitense TaxID=1398745 RepID=UPI0013ED1C44|nr:aminotransferase class I/II-fold pyridoxal phosphate-dependent enzyme [Litoribacterium kuwaitense]NGP44429.1 aminotransferase class I/II-fold pyridoxal phosphate-dependent enzyme [Litoribacterium kuwaitense]
MEQWMNSNAREIEISGIRRFFNKVADVPEAIQLTIGQPDFPTPDVVKEAAIEAIQGNQTTYTANAGILPLRQAVSQHVSTYGLSYDPISEIIVTTGASQGIDVALRSLLIPGDEVILPAPVYPGYEPIIRMCGATPRFIDTRNTGFVLQPEQVLTAINHKTKALILPYPSNPTGCQMTAAELTKLADVLADQNIFVLSDEIYSELCFAAPHASIACDPRMREKTIVIQGVSKSHAMTGWRIGFLLAPEPLAKHMLKVHQYNVSCASSVSQHAALAALTKAPDAPKQMRQAYETRAAFVTEALDEMGIPYVRPTGGFYVFCDIRQFGQDSETFSSRLLYEHGLALIPGTAFSSYGEGFLRLSFAYSMEQLQEGLARLKNFVSTLV